MMEADDNADWVVCVKWLTFRNEDGEVLDGIEVVTGPFETEVLARRWARAIRIAPPEHCSVEWTGVVQLVTPDPGWSREKRHKDETWQEFARLMKQLDGLGKGEG